MRADGHRPFHSLRVGFESVARTGCVLRPDRRLVRYPDIARIHLVDLVVSAEQHVVPHRVTVQSRPSLTTCRHQQRVEEVQVMQLVVHDATIGCYVASAQVRMPIHMMRVPVAQVFDRRVFGFDPPEDLGLVVSVLEEAGPRPPGVRSRFDDATRPHHQRVTLQREVPHHPPARLVAVVAVALLEHALQGRSGDFDPDRSHIPHRAHSCPPHTMQPSCGRKDIRCSSKFFENGWAVRLPHTR